MKEVEYTLTRTNDNRIFLELKVPRLSKWKRSIAHLRSHSHKNTFKDWEVNDAFKRFEASDQYGTIMALINAFRITSSNVGWKRSQFSDKETISFVHELDNGKINF